MRVRIKTPSRLHFGIIDLSGALGRNYGSIGLAIDEPSYEIVAEESEKFEVIGEDREQAREIILRIAQIFDLSDRVKINVIRSIPRHVGLGSTTQLTLALGRALAELHGKKIPTLELAQKTGRGKQSGIGTYAFEAGGFIIDGGKKTEGFPPLILRLDLPTEWRFVIVVPRIGRGLSEEAESEIFQRVRASVGIAQEICHSLMMRMLPSIVERDIEDFGRALTQVDRLVGEAFSPHQKGIFYSEVVSEIIDCMLEHGAYGAGQSSWGPTVYGLVKGETQGNELQELVKNFLEEKGHGGLAMVVKPNNWGAEIEIT